MNLSRTRERVRLWVLPRWEWARPRLEWLGHKLGLDRVTQRLVVLAACASILVMVMAWQRCGLRGCPNVQRLVAYQPGGASLLIDRNGRRFADLAPIRYQVVPLKSLPVHVPAAFLAVEDKRFYNHHGVDWHRVAGAAVVNLKSRRVKQGSSTITMQLARNLFPKVLPRQQRTFRRKLLEVRVARSMERKFTKDEILELYLNHIYFGNGAYGIEAAAQQYFRRRARDLTVSQAAMLAALPKAPAHYDPRRRPAKARARRDLVIALMEQQTRITARQAASARKTVLRVSRPPRRNERDDGFAPYFVDAVRRQLEDQFGDAVYESKLKVYTTLDITAQRAAEEELSHQLRVIESGGFGRFRAPRYASTVVSDEQGTRYLQGAVVVLEAATGDVLAQVGGRDFLDSPFNRATYATRQLGSAFKPFVYAAAIEQGVSPSQRLIDEPMQLPISRRVVWEPRNYDGQFVGEISVREALVQSRNVPTVRLAAATGYDAIVRVARRAGLRGEIDDHASMPLGTVSASPIELASAYSVFATGGRTNRPRYIERIEDQNGKVIWQPPSLPDEGAMDPAVAFIVTDILRDAVNRGTATTVRSAGFHAAAAGKTGTTNDGTDAWFVGYTPDLVAAVWVGFDQQRSILPNATGGRLAAPVWGRMMRRIYVRRRDPGDFLMPAGVVRRQIDPVSGLVLELDCWPRWEEPATELFLEGREPELVCPSRGRWLADLFGGIGDHLELGRQQVEDWLSDEEARERARRQIERYLDAERDRLDRRRRERGRQR